MYGAAANCRFHIINLRNLAKVWKSVHGSFPIARTILKQEVDPPWSTTTIVSCSTSLHRQPLSWYRRWTMKSDPCCIVVNPRTPKCQCCLWAARLAPVDKKIKPWTQRKLDRVLFNIEIWGVGFCLVMSVTVGFDFFVHLLYVSPFNSGENNISHGISSPGLKTHLMSGHFQWSKTKKMIQSEIQHGFSQCCLPWIIMNLTHFQMFSMVPAAAHWGCWWTPARWPRWTAPAPRPRRRRWAPPTGPDPRPNQRPRPRQGWHLAISGCKGRMGSV